MRPAAARQRLRSALRRLQRRFGPRSNEPEGSPVGVLIGTILSQNTSNANSSAGLRQLWRRFRSYSAIAGAPVGEIERCIRVSGLSRIKAPRIKAILAEVRSRSPSGRPSLEFLRGMGDEEAYRYLLGLKGIGPKTAACVLLFAFGRGVFPVDTHIRRIAIRLGLLPSGTGAERAQEILGPLIPPKDRYAMHVLLITLGRQICRARGPLCPSCPLLALCPFGRRRARARR